MSVGNVLMQNIAVSYCSAFVKVQDVHQCKGARYCCCSSKGVRCNAELCIYPIPMLLFVDNSDSPSTVEQLSQGPSFSYNTFISDSFLAL